MTIGEHARPFLTFHVGQAGVQIGHAIWELLCMEHNIQTNGVAKPSCPSNGFYDAMFLKSSSGHFMPRSIFVDTDPTCIDEVRVGPYRELFGANQLLSDSNDACFNYMRGRHDFNKRLVPDTVERFRWLLEKTDATPATFLIHGISGGTGGGLAVSCLEALNNDFGSSLQVLELNVTSGRGGLQNSCEMINQVLYQHESSDFTTVSFSATNSAMYNVCRTGLNLSSATYAHVNRMLAMCFSNLTAMERFPGTVPCSVGCICNSVLPFKHLKHPVLACAPFSTMDMVGKERLNVIGVTSAVMEVDGQLADIDLRRGQHMASVLLYRGAAKPSDIEQAMAMLKAKGKTDFVDWAPANFRTGLIELPPLAVPLSGIGGTSLSVTMVSNHTAIASLFRGQSDGVKKLASGGYFLHNYENATAGGIESGHNSSIANLLKEACEHMDEIANVYEGEVPPDQAPASSSRHQRDAAERDRRNDGLQERRKSGETPLGGETSADGVKPQYGETSADGVKPQYGETSADGVKPQYGETTADGVKPQYGETTPAANDMTWKTGGGYEGQAQQQHEPIQEGAAGREDIQPVMASPEDQEGHVTAYSAEEHPNDQSTLGTTSEATPGSEHQGANGTADDGCCAGCCKKTGFKKDGSCCKKGSCKGNCKDGSEKDKSRRRRKRTRGKDANPQATKRSQSGCCKSRSSSKGSPARGGHVRAQSQNHANSMTHYLPWSATTDTDSCRSANCTNPGNYRYYTGTGSGTSAHTLRRSLHDYSSVSTHSAESAADLNDIIQNCLPGPDQLAVDDTISSVRQIIQKYNEMFAQNANGAAPETAWSRK